MTCQVMVKWNPDIGRHPKNRISTQVSVNQQIVPPSYSNLSCLLFGLFAPISRSSHLNHSAHCTENRISSLVLGQLTDRASSLILALVPPIQVSRTYFQVIIPKSFSSSHRHTGGIASSLYPIWDSPF